MKRQEVAVTATSTAAADTLYRLLCDRAAVVVWSPMSECELERPGEQDPEGVGSVRRQRLGRTVGYDTIIELRPGRLFRYSHEGLPVNGYVGTVTLTPVDGGCRVDWSSSFTPRYPLTGWLLRRGVRRFLTDCVTGLASYAETATP